MAEAKIHNDDKELNYYKGVSNVVPDSMPVILPSEENGTS
jgi:hypothetical protein